MGDGSVCAKVNFFGEIKDVLGQTVIRLEINKNSSLRDVLELLCQKYGSLVRERLFENGGNVFSHIVFIINGARVNSIEIDQPLDYRQQDEIIAEVFILPMQEGG